MTGGDLTFRVSRSLGLDDTQGGDELKLMQSWANDAIIDVLIKTRCTVSWNSVALSAGVTEYTLDTTFLAVQSIKGPTALGTGPWRIVSMQEIMEFQESGTAYADPPLVAIDGGNYMTVAPAPAADENLSFLAVIKPTPLFSAANLGTTTDNSNDPYDSLYGLIPSEYHRALEYYMLWRGAEYDDKLAATYGKGAAQGYLDRYNDELKMIRRAKTRLAGRGLSGAKAPGYPATRHRGGRNDTYSSFDR